MCVCVLGGLLIPSMVSEHCLPRYSESRWQTTTAKEFYIFVVDGLAVKITKVT
jgi:hypothetical protein